ncbi:hypothetical protein [Geobacillus sp. JS12]|nr:hypothetical protein [Geobacillus sp. JS12]
MEKQEQIHWLLDSRQMEIEYVNYPPPTLRLEVGASSDLCVFAER